MSIFGGLGGILIIILVTIAGLNIIAQKFNLYFNKKWSKALIILSLLMIFLSLITHFYLYKNNWVWSGVLTNNLIYILTIIAFILTAIFTINSIIPLWLKSILNIFSVGLCIVLIFQIATLLGRINEKFIFQNDSYRVEMKRFMGPPRYYLFENQGIVNSFEEIKFENMEWPLEVEVKNITGNKLKVYYKRFDEQDSMTIKVVDGKIVY